MTPKEKQKFRLSGSKGGKKASAKLTKAERSARAKKAAQTRWAKRRKPGQ